VEEKESEFKEETTSIVNVEEMSLEESQVAEQLYNSAGLGPVVEAGLKDYDKELRKEDKLISKVFGARATDIRSYGEAVAKRVAFAVYALLNKQYGGKVGDLRSYIMTLQEERDRANTRYDELMGRVVGILGEEYKDLRTDSKEFMERLTTVLGEDLKESRIDKKELAESLADIDGLRSRIKALEEEKVQLTEKHESQISSLNKEHSEEVENSRSQIAELDSRIDKLESEKTALASDLEQLRKDHEQLKEAMKNLASSIPDEGIGKKLKDDLYAFILTDSKVPDRVIGGVGKFIDFKKYLGVAADRGAEEVGKRIEETLRTTS
jgi:outer membrane murein-binding lipoprotein Lpp